MKMHEPAHFAATGAALAQALLRPRSVALIGASDDPGKTAGRPLKFLRAAGFQGAIYPINPKRATVQGERAYPDLASLPQVPDHVFILTPTESVLDAVREAAAAGVKVATVLASGFSESGEQGRAREEALREVARRGGVRLLGPSSLGVVLPSTGLVLTANAAFAEPDLPGAVTAFRVSGHVSPSARCAVISPRGLPDIRRAFRTRPASPNGAGVGEYQIRKLPPVRRGCSSTHRMWNRDSRRCRRLTTARRPRYR